MIVGYRRISSSDGSQKFDRQDLGNDVERIFQDEVSGSSTDRKALQEMLSFCGSGDLIKVFSIDRLARSLQDLLSIIQLLQEKGVKIEFLSEGLTFSNDKADPFQMLQLSMIGSVAEFERSMIRSRQKQGIALAKANGVYSKAKKINQDKIRQLRSEGIGATEICRRLSCSRTSVYNAFKQVA